MTITAPVRSKSKAIQLSEKDRAEGVRILNSLQTVERAKRLNDHIPTAAANVVKNEQCHVDFVRFIRRVAGYEVDDQRKVVAELLVSCYDSPS